MSLSMQADATTAFRRVLKPLAPDFSRPAVCIQGLLCDVVTLNEARRLAMACINSSQRCSIVTPNTDFLRLIRSDPEFRDAVLANDLSIIDGMPLVWLARALGVPARDRVCGCDLFDTLMHQSSEHFSAFFFGATDEIGRRVRDRLDDNRSGLRCAGAYAPGFGSVESMSTPFILDSINKTDPDLLVVSVGARKGLLWLNRNEHLLSAPIICNLGATINFVAGSVRRAPAHFRRYGLEWLWRIWEEPKLYARYALDLATLLSVLIREILPCMIQGALHEPSPAQLAAARLQHSHRDSEDFLAFSGPWTKDNLAPLRAALTAATRDANDIVVDLDHVTFVDAAFLGQILLAYGYQRRMHRGFALCATNSKVKRMLQRHGCGFLLMTRQDRFVARPIRLRPPPTGPAGAHHLWKRMSNFAHMSWINFHEH
ncbi:WecB/TagA/CpsF family glycosyltransferase [Bradyrhizobium sp. CB1650]|uniref:WecB/TagA/CpsF family glycosyltransferase n=1 Tax=Bradyrhizobium sp. CB1650 TaxID=3039153 RepID=UPI002434AE8D|nr:WecB/TagA/CpsF family glycosyltransferase [Bradyrhizobium sp. CB1650]WGD54933.1 WecB/TagA/CpsF family glycosyltransferase [Bradyrhizobium sp. CB1650]